MFNDPLYSLLDICIFIIYMNQSVTAHIIRSSNMRQLARAYRKCKSTCSLPIPCVFRVTPAFYKVLGTSTISSNSFYNTILTITTDIDLVLYIPINVHVKIVLAADPNTVVLESDFFQQPGTYTSPAGTYGWILTVSFNIPAC